MIELDVKNNILNKCTTDEKVIVIPDYIYGIRDKAFYNQDSIEEIIMNDEIEYLGFCVFENCTNLKKIKLSKKIKALEFNTFKNCYNLEDINLNYIEEIYKHSFVSCNKLNNIKFSSKLNIIASNAFIECNNLDKISISANNKYFEAIEGVLYSKNLEELVLYPSGKTQSSFIIPPFVKRIRDYQFESNHLLKSITFNENITEISEYAFLDCTNLIKVGLSNNITKISPRAFKNCKSLSYINVPSSVKIISDYAFDGCKSLEYVMFNEGLEEIYTNVFKDCIKLDNVYLPVGLKRISSFAFDSCICLKELLIPKTINYLGEEILKNVSEDLLICYEGNSQEWKNLTKERITITSHQSQNDFHHYGDSVDDIIPTTYKVVKVIPINSKYKVFCKEDSVLLDYSK